MKRLFLLMALLGPGLVACEREPPVPSAAPRKLATVQGVISEVEGNTLRLDTPGRAGPVQFELDERTGLSMGGVPVGREVLHEGLQVRATYRTVGEERTLLHLELAPTRAPSTPLVP